MTPIIKPFKGKRPCLRASAFVSALILTVLLPAVARAQITYTGSAANQNFGSQAIGSTSTAKTFSFSVAAGTTVGSIGVVTQGAPNLDLNSTTGGTCAAKDYSSTTTCTVNVTFKPKAAGLRQGAVVFYSAANNTGNQLGSVPIYGVGTGPQIAYGPGTVVNIFSELGNTSLRPNATAVDGAGNLFISDVNGNGVVEVPAGGHTWTEIYPTANGIQLTWPAGLAVDGAGNLFIANQGGASVLEVPAGGGAAIAIQPVVNGTGLYEPAGVVLDAVGDLFIGDYGNNRVVEVPAGNGVPILINPTVAGKTLNLAAGLALDVAGDLFIADDGNNRVVEVPAGGGAATAIDPTVDGLGLSTPTDVAVDGAGDLFIADCGNSRVVEVPAGGGAATATQIAGLAQPNGLTLDDAGDQFISSNLSPPQTAALVEVLRSQPPTVYFPTPTAVGTTDTTDGTLTAQVQNVGNAALTLTALSYPPDFPEASGDANACTSSTSLSAGQECDVPVEFTPESAGSLSESVTLTDNALNAAPPEYAQQSISVAGNGNKLNSIAIAPSSSFATLPGGSQQFTATGSYSDGSTQNLTSQVSWKSSNTTAVTVGASGLATAQAAGAAMITASLSGVTSNAVTFTIDSAAQASITASSGSGQSAYETVAFPNPLVAVVKDMNGNALQKVPVTFTAPASGAGALFSNGTATIVANTDSTGTATVTATANSAAGSYNVTATVDSLSASFSLTNLAWPVYSVTTLVDDSTGLATNCTDPTLKLTSCSLRDAVTAANALPQTTTTPVTAAMMPTINFASSLHLSAQSPGTYNITNGSTLTISANMNIVGPGANLLNVNGAGNNQIFNISSGTVFLSGLSLVNGAASSGGGIYNNGTLTVTNSTFSGNSASGGYGGDGFFGGTGGYGSGGGIYNGGTLTVTNSTFSGNSATGGSGGDSYDDGGSGGYGGNGSGGGISNGGRLTVTNSTFSGNGATGGAGGDAFGSCPGSYGGCPASNGGDAYGGGISNGGTLTVTNSTFSGNSATGGFPGFGVGFGVGVGGPGFAYGGGIENGGTLTVANGIFSGNSASNPLGFDDYGAGIYNNSLANADSSVYFNNLTDGSEDDCNGCTTNTKAVSGNPLLAALGNYGGATQTMLPQPGSAAICAGTVGDIPVGVTTDQRGFARTNTSYEEGTVCVDAGAVQTHYAMAFTTEPPPIVPTGQPISPAPVVALTESGAAATAVTSSVAMTDSAALLSGTTTASFLPGTATFSNLLIPSVTSSDKLIATLALNSTLNLTARSTVFQALTTAITSPTPGSVLDGPSATFIWTSVDGATSYDLWLGTTGVGSNNVWSSGSTTATSVTFGGLPTNGETIYARLWTYFNGGSVHADFTYTADTLGLISPTPGSTFTGPSATFTWTAASGATHYDLWLGTTGVGSNNLWSSGGTTATSVTFGGLPTNGEKVYARLFTFFNGSSVHADYSYTAVSAAVMTSPTPGSTLAGASATFMWTAAGGATGYDLWIGTTGVGSNNVWSSGGTTGTSVTFNGLPTNGATIYVRLFTFFNGVEVHADYTYTVH